MSYYKTDEALELSIKQTHETKYIMSNKNLKLKREILFFILFILCYYCVILFIKCLKYLMSLFLNL